MGEFGAIELASILMQAKYGRNDKSRLVPYIVGDPGVGKTSTIEQLGKSFEAVYGTEVPVITINPHMYDPFEVCGLPAIVNDSYKITAPPWFTDIRDYDGPAILLLDEISSLSTALQSKLLRLLAHGELNYKLGLPATTMVIAAGNPSQTATDAFLFDPAFSARLCFIKWDAQSSFDYWMRGMISGCQFEPPTIPVLPADWKKLLPIWGACIAGFVRSHMEFECHPSEGNEPWPTRRTWTYGAVACAAVEACGGSNEEIGMVLTGCVGQKAAGALMSWKEVQSVVDVEELLQDAVRRVQNGKKVLLPEAAVRRLDIVFAIVAALLSCLYRDTTDDRYNAVCALLTAMCDAGFSEAATYGAIALFEQHRRKLPADLLKRLQTVHSYIPFKS